MTLKGSTGNIAQCDPTTGTDASSTPDPDHIGRLIFQLLAQETPVHVPAAEQQIFNNVNLSSPVFGKWTNT